MKINVLSGNMLKIIAALSMVIDHTGMLFFPKVQGFRIAGRLAFPIFAYMIAEGCKYTKNKARYFAVMFFPAVICQGIYAALTKEKLYLCVLVTFSAAIAVIYAMQNFKTALLENGWGKNATAHLCVFVLSVAIVWGLNKCVKTDYGFWGCMLPVWVSIPQAPSADKKAAFEKTDNRVCTVTMLAAGLAVLSANAANVKLQMYSLAAIPVMLLYSGKRGRWKMKYFFYVFYPLHLAILGGIYLLTKAA